MGVKGRIHSIESFGAVDGPGIRYVVFFQGCPLRCLYCHNPDSWCVDGGELTDSEDVVNKILSYKNFIKKGGVTLSGGEPTMQPAFLLDILTRLKENGIHTAVDTAGSIKLDIVKPIIDTADMLLLDIKSLNSLLCEDITGQSNKNGLEILRYCETINKPVWIRHVLVPGYTLKKKLLEQLALYLKDFKCVEKVELLPFHKMGEFKWNSLGKKYRLYDILEPAKIDVDIAKQVFIEQGFDM